MKLSYQQFSGMRPAVDPRVLASGEALDAEDCDLRYQTAQPFLAPDPSTLTGIRHEPLGYLAAGLLDNAGTPINHLHDITHYEDGGVPKGVYDVNERGTCIAPSVVARDAHQRVYFSRPEGGVYDRGRTDGSGAFEERTVGVPAPVDPDLIQAPTVSPRDDSEAQSGFNMTWFYYIEEILAPNTISEQGGLSQNNMVLETINDLFDNATFRYTYDVPITTLGHPFFGYDDTVYHFIMYAEMTSLNGRFLGTVYPSPSIRQEDTDAFVGGTRAVATMGLNEDATPDDLYFCDVLFNPAGDEYSYYRSYLFTYVTDRGEESGPSASTDPFSVLPSQKVDLKIDIANAPDNAELVRIYRTETTEGGTSFFFVADVTIVSSQVVYEDLLLSVDLPGDTLQTLNWDAPPDDLKGLVLSTKGFYAGYVGNKLMLSEPFVAYAWPTDFAIDFTGDITHISRYGDNLAVFTDREIALIVGNTPLEVRKIKVEGFENLTSIFSTTEMDGLLYFACTTGIAVISGSNVAIVTDELLSERFWRDSINSSQVRLASLDNTIYMLSDPDDQVWRIGLQEDGGGLVKLSDANIRDLYSSSYYLGVIMLPSSESDFYVFNIGADVPRTVRWRGRVEVAQVPMSIITVRVLADEYPVTLRIFEGEDLNPVPNGEIVLSSDKIRKLPVYRRGREWSFEVEGDTNIVGLELGTSGRVR